MEEKSYPYNDNDMEYDASVHRYVLTADCVLRETGINLAGEMGSEGSKRFLARVSRTVYLYLYENAWGEDWLEYVLAVYPPLRDTVREMLIAQTEYTLRNNEVNRYSGVNVAKGTVMDIGALRGRAKIANEVEQLAYQTVPGLGICLKYAGRLPAVPAQNYRNGY